MIYIDTHAHLGDPRFDADRDDVLARATASGIGRIVEIADHPDEWDRAVAIARSHPNSIRCALGLHPYYSDQFSPAFIERLKKAVAAAPETVAIGEIGLDYAKSEIPRAAQLAAFEGLAAAGKSWDFPLVVHCRDAFVDLIPALKRLFPTPPASRRFWGVIHCFTGTPEDAVSCTSLGFALGADGPVTYKKNDALREAFRRVGSGAVVLETDCPWLPPQSRRGQRNEPTAILEIAAKLSEVWSLPAAEVAANTCRNAAELYRWPC